MFLIFSPIKNAGDYHGKIYHENYEKWVKKLIPNLHLTLLSLATLLTTMCNRITLQVQIE